MDLVEGLLILLILVVVAAGALRWAQTRYGVLVGLGTTVHVMTSSGRGLTVGPAGASVGVTASPTALRLYGASGRKGFAREGDRVSLYDPGTKKFVVTATVGGACVVATSPTASAFWYFQGPDMKSDGSRVVPGKGYVLSPVGEGACQDGMALGHDLVTWGGADAASADLWAIGAAP